MQGRMDVHYPLKDGCAGQEVYSREIGSSQMQV